METFLRSALLVGLAFLLLVVQSTFAVLYSIHPFEPNLLLPIVIFLGVAQDVQIVRGMVVSFLVGYVFDLFTGNPLSLQTFLMTGGFLVARFAGLRFVLRGPSFQALLTFVASVVAGAVSLALRGLFDKPVPFQVEGAVETFFSLVGPAATTAMLAPLVFFLVRRIEAIATTTTRRTAEEVTE